MSLCLNYCIKNHYDYNAAFSTTRKVGNPQWEITENPTSIHFFNVMYLNVYSQAIEDK